MEADVGSDRKLTDTRSLLCKPVDQLIAQYFKNPQSPRLEEVQELLETLQSCYRGSEQPGGSLDQNAAEPPENLAEPAKDLQAEIAEGKWPRQLPQAHQLRYLLAETPAIIYAAKASGNHATIFISNHVKSQLGHESFDFTNHPGFWAENIHPNDAYSVFAGIHELFRHDQHVSEYRFRHKDGTYRWIRDEMKLVRDAKGKPLEILGCRVDITDRKQDEELLIAQRDLGVALGGTASLKEALDLCLKTALQISGMRYGGIYLVDDMGNLRLSVWSGMSEPFVKSVSYYTPETPNWQLVMTAKPYHTPWERLNLPSPDWPQGDIPGAVSIIPVLHQGRVIACFNMAHFGSNEVCLSAQVALESIAMQIGNAIARLQTEEKLRDSQAWRKAILDSIPDPAWLLDPDGRLLAVNNAWCRFRGLEEKQVLGKTAFDLLPGEVAEKIQRENLEILHTGMQRGHEELQTDSHGRAVWFEIIGGPLFDEYGDIIGAVGIGRDITARKKAEEELKAANARMKQTMTQLRAMASELTHAEQRERRRLALILHDNLQQILFGAKLRIRALQNRLENQEIHHLLAIIDEMLNEAITETSSLTIELSPPVLYETGLAAALQWLAGHIEEKHGLIVEVHADPDIGSADETTRVFLFQAVRELLFNVVKHAQTSRAAIRLSKTNDGMLQIEVSDDGVGYDPASTQKHAGAGGGFGLFSISERLEPLGGKVQIETAPGKGTRVAIVVPRNQA